MGTQRFRSSTLPALRRTARRVVAQRRLPRHIVPNLKAALRRRLAPVATFFHRMSPGRLVAHRGAGPNDRVLHTGAGWRATLPVDAVSADELLVGHLAEVMRVLEAAGAHPFVADPSPPPRRPRSSGGTRRRIGVFEEHRTAALKALRRAHFEMTELIGRGEAMQALGSRPARIAVWRYRHLGGGVVADEEYGVDVEFWREESIGRVVPDGRRGLASFVPDPQPGATVTVRDRTHPTHSTFAAELGMRRIPFPIDIVYTWVDGSDPVWQESYREHLRLAGNLNPEAANFSRYANRDELRYSMRSLWWYADFFRHVYLVTAGHLPDWLDTSHPRLTVVTHAELFPEDSVPTFNSHAIETRLHHIPGLAEHYLYLNDDVFFARVTEPGLYFSPNGISRMFLSTAPIPPGEPTANDAPVDAAAKNGRRLLAQEFGYVPARKLRHAPHPQIKSVVAETVARFPEEVAATTRARFRSTADVSLAASLSQHVGLVTARTVVSDISTQYINIANRWAPGQLATLAERRNCDVFCLNETSMTDAYAHRVDPVVARFLDRYFPRPSPFERQSSSTPPPPVNSR